MKPKFGSQLVIGLGLTAFMLFAGTGVAHAQRWDDGCRTRIQRDQEAVDRAFSRYGYDSRQAQHERNELQADAENCGYPSGYRDDDRGYQDRDERWGYQDRGYQSGYDNPAYDIGYRDGVAIGQKDSQKGKSFRPEKNDRFEDADHGYNKSYGDKNYYKSVYREGFQRGYSDGYRQWR